jgi:uncharacterized protein YcbK (DUF882 family)
MKRISALLLVLLVAACNGTGPAANNNNKDLIGTGLPKTHADPLERRSIVFLHPESGERLDIVYFHDGHYDAKALRAVDRLFRDRHAGVIGKIDPALIDFLVDIRTRLDLPSTVTFEILSGYRTPETNIILAKHNGNVAIESLHTHGWAVDFRIAGVDGRAIAAVAKTMQRGAAVFYPSSNHVHVDIGNIRNWHEK